MTGAHHQPRNLWTAEQRATLERMVAQRASWSDIAAATGHASGSCQATMSKMRAACRAVADPAAVTPATAVMRYWTAEEIADLFDMRDNKKMRWLDIDKKLGRGRGASCGKYTNEHIKQKQVSRHFGNGRMDAAAAINEAKARSRLEHTTLTAAIFGDPLPGRSALDKKRSVPA